MANIEPPALPNGKWVNPDGTPTLAFLEYQARLSSWAKGIKAAAGGAYGIYTNGTPDRGTLDIAAVTVSQLARFVAAIITDLKNAKVLP